MMNRPDATVHGRPLHVLIVEDRDDDLLLLLHELERSRYCVDYVRVESVPALESALTSGRTWDIVLSDFSLPTMTALDVVRTVSSTRPDLPCIVLSGTITEEGAVEVLKAGARDFVVKERMARLVPAIERELRESADRRRMIATETALQEARERMQFALEAVETGFWTWDVRSNTMIWSDVMERLHGLQPGAFGGTFAAVIERLHPEGREDALRQFESAQRTAADFRIEYRVLRTDGSVRWMGSIGRMFADSAGTPVRAAGVTMDITTQKASEEQLRQAQKMDSIGSLAGGIAHDFNNLLTVIGGCCELASPRVAHDAEAAESLRAIAAAAASATALTRQLLTFSRAHAATPRLLDLHEVMRSFGGVLRRLIHANVQIDWQLSADDCLVNADPAQIEQLLLNLVANARDAMPQGGTVLIQTGLAVVPEAESRLPAELQTGRYVVLTISDDGTGMPDHVKARIFEPFFTTKAIGHGTGLGLATVYGIVKQNHGHIHVTSELGKGTVFTIFLPRASGADGVIGPRSIPGADVSGSETILVVDDNAPLRQLTARVLQRHGYHVLLANDGEEAEQRCREHQGSIDVVLMDVIMPGENGPAVSARIRAYQPAIKTIYTSGYAFDALEDQDVARECYTFLQKPFNATQLVQAVRDVLAVR